MFDYWRSGNLAFVFGLESGGEFNESQWGIEYSHNLNAVQCDRAIGGRQALGLLSPVVRVTLVLDQTASPASVLWYPRPRSPMAQT